MPCPHDPLSAEPACVQSVISASVGGVPISHTWDLQRGVLKLNQLTSYLPNPTMANNVQVGLGDRRKGFGRGAGERVQAGCETLNPKAYRATPTQSTLSSCSV